MVSARDPGAKDRDSGPAAGRAVVIATGLQPIWPISASIYCFHSIANTLIGVFRFPLAPGMLMSASDETFAATDACDTLALVTNNTGGMT